MSHYRFFSLFRDQKETTFSLERLAKTLEQYGCTLSPRNDGDSLHVCTPINVAGRDEIGSEGGIQLAAGESVLFSVHRPYYDQKFLSLAAELITKLGLVMWSEADEGTCFVHDAAVQAHIPPEMCTKAVVVHGVDDLRFD